MYSHTKWSIDAQQLGPIFRTVNVVPDFQLHTKLMVSELNAHSTLFITMHIIWWQLWSPFHLLSITADLDQSCYSVKDDYKSTKFIHVFKFCAYLKYFLKFNFPILWHVQETCKALNLQTKDVRMCCIVRAFTHTSRDNEGMTIIKTKLKTIIHH